MNNREYLSQLVEDLAPPVIANCLGGDGYAYASARTEEGTLVLAFYPAGEPVPSLGNRERHGR